MGIRGNDKLVDKEKIETWSIQFPATVDDRGRITIKKEVLDVAKIQPGDTAFLTLTGVAHKGVQA